MQNIHKTVNTKSRRICSVPQCSTYCTPGVSLHFFPKDPKLSKAWQNILKIGKPISKYMFVCSLHFEEKDFTQTSVGKRRLKKDVIPSKKLPKLSHPSSKSMIDRTERHWLQRSTVNVLEPNLLDPNPMVEPVPLEETNIPVVSTVKVPFYSPPLPDCFYENKATNTQFSDFFELPQILDNDEKLMNFTGINSAILETILQCARNTAHHNQLDQINLKTSIILVMCKLKMNITFACLAVLFGLSKTQCRRTFYKMVSLLAVSLKPAIFWPSKEHILRNMPHCFAKFKNTRVVLDCTEISIQKLKCLKCRLASYSHYKGTHTIKYLIGITPCGIISFASSGFGGRATDKAIFNHENLINKLEENDAIMVDKGILIEKECLDKNISLIRPPFLRKKKQFSKEEAEATAEIARARVHVERAIQRLKIFKILSHKFGWFLIPYADEIMTVIAAVVNLTSPILADNKIEQ